MLEQVQRRVSKLIRGLAVDWLRELGLFSLEKGRLWGTILKPLSISRGPARKMEKDFLPRPVVIGQQVLNSKKVGIDRHRGRNFLL